MAVEEQDKSRMTEVLKQAKEKGLKTVVLLNISGPVEMGTGCHTLMRFFVSLFRAVWVVWLQQGC